MRLFLIPGALLLVLAGCGQTGPGNDLGSRHDMDGAPARDTLPALPTELPGRHVSEVSRYSFSSVDMIDGSPTAEYVDGEGLLMMMDDPNYAVFGATIDHGKPVRLDAIGYCNDMWIAVADFQTGYWRWLAGGLHTGALIDLPDNVLGPANQMYILLYTKVDTTATDVRLAVVTDNDDPGDEEPPQWTGAEGIVSAEGMDPLLKVDYNPATDAGTAPEPIAYLVFADHHYGGIDWTRPIDIFVDDGSGEYIAEYPDGVGINIDVAVRAMDVKGNITTNTNFVTIDYPEEDGSPPPAWIHAEWQPGDKLALRWENSGIDLGIAVSNTNTFDEGDPEFPEFSYGTFISSRENIAAGTAEEWVSITPAAQPGYYKIEVRASFEDEHTFEHAVLELRHHDGTVDQLAEYDFGGYLGFGQDVGFMLRR